MKGIKRLLILTTVFLFILLVTTLVVKSVFATQTSHHTEWSDWTIKSTSDCIQTECGKSDGTQNVTYQRQCVQVSGHGDNECELKVCPEGYPNVSQQHNGYCYKGNHPEFPEDYKQMVDNIQTKTELDTACQVEEPTQCEVTPTPTPEATPEAQPVDHSGPVGAPICTDNGVKFAPTITRMWRNGKGDVDMKWTTTDTSDFIVYFGLSGKDLNWNTGRITGQGITLHDTPNVLLDGIVCSVSPCGAEKCSVRFIDP